MLQTLKTEEMKNESSSPFPPLKTLKTPMVNLLKYFRPFQNLILEIQLEINLLTFLNTDRNAPKKFKTVII